MVKNSSKRLGIGPPGGGTVTAAAARQLTASMPSHRVRPTLSPAPVRPGSPVTASSSLPPARRGSLAVALAAAASPESMDAAVHRLLVDRYAPNSNIARASWLRTWLRMHQAAFARSRVQPPPFPLTPEIITRVAALFKAGNYLSFDNYMARAKSEHLSLGIVGPGSWSHELSAAAADACRSCARGTGTSRQSKPLDAIGVAGLQIGDAPLVVGGPVAPRDFAVAGCFFLLREVELAAAMASHVTVASDDSSATWLLPSTKTDPRAVGVCRTWECCCGLVAMAPACPVHALKRQLQRVHEFAGSTGRNFNDMPLFHTLDGDEVTRQAAVATINRLVELMGLPIVGTDGSLLYGGHSLRTGGASMLAARGVNPFKIQSLGRWRSPLVIHYAGEAMAGGIAGDIKSSAASSSAGAPECLAELRRFLARLEERIDRLEPVDAVAPRPPPSAEVEAPVVQNLITKVYHRTIAHASDPPQTHKSVCGWVFAERVYRRLAAVPAIADYSKVCPKCLPAERQHALDASGTLSEIE